MRSTALAVSVTSASVLAMVAVGLTASPAAAQVDGVNPVRVPVSGHPANSGFLVFVEGDVALNLDEAEGTVAAGGNLSFTQNYQVALGAGVFDTFTAPGDTDPTTLYVGGGIVWPGNSSILQVLRGNTKVADRSTYTADNTDSNGAAVNYRLVEPGAAYESTPAITGTNRQTPESIATPVGTELVDVAGAYSAYRTLTSEIGACAATIELTDAGGEPLTEITPGQAAFVTLAEGQTNVLEISAADLADLSEITFRNQPSASTPLVVNVTGPSFVGDLPNLAGVSGAEAPYMLWNFPTATSVTVTGGDRLEGTLYAPSADVTWLVTANIEGNVIAANFNHGPASRGVVREVHDFPFATTITCSANPVLAELTLVKEVVGGTAAPGDWTLGAAGLTSVSGASGAAGVTDVTVEPGSYELSESGPAGYAPGAWSCDGGTLTGTTLVVPPGADITCRIINAFITPTPTPTPTRTCPADPATTPTSPGATTPTSPGATTGGRPGCAILAVTGPSDGALLGLVGALLVVGGVTAVLLGRRRSTD